MQPERQREVLAGSEVGVLDLLDQVEVAGADFVEQADCAPKPAPVLGDVELQPLADVHAGPHARREPVVALGIPGGLPVPELAVKHRVEVNACRQGLEVNGRCLAREADAPGDVVLLHGHGHHAAMSLMLGHKAKHDGRLPVAPAVNPARASREQAHVACKLDARATGRKAVPEAVVALKPFHPGSHVGYRVGLGAVDVNGVDTCHLHGVDRLAASQQARHG